MYWPTDNSDILRLYIVSLGEQELLTFPEHLSSPSVLRCVRVTRSLVLCVCFVDRCLSFCLVSFGHFIVCPPIYGFWLPRWYLQTRLATIATITHQSIFTQTVGSSCYLFSSSNFSCRLHILLSCFTCVVLYLRIVICCVPTC
jgi:hypothetical protein